MAGNKNCGVLPSQKAGEQGYLLLGLLFLFALILIGLAIAAPRIGKEIQREKEIETVHRGEQYKRAIQLYYRKFGAYPTSLDQLKKTNNVRFLRQEYIDPMTGKKDWKLLHLGQVRMVAMGFFGKQLQTAGIPGVPGAGLPGTPAGALTGASTGALGGSGTAANSASTNDDSFFNDASSTNSTAGASNSGTSGTASQQSTDASDNGTSSGSGISSGSSLGGGLGGSSLSGGLNGSTSSGFGGSGIGSTNPTSSTTGGIFGSTNGTAAGGTPGATGGPIVGVTVPLKTHSMLTYRKQSEYDKWQFVYNPQEEISAASGQLGAATSGTGIGTPAGSSSFGSSSGFGSTGSGIGSSSTGSSSFGGGGFGSTSSPSPSSSPSTTPF